MHIVSILYVILIFWVVAFCIDNFSWTVAESRLFFLLNFFLACGYSWNHGIFRLFGMEFWVHCRRLVTTASLLIVKRSMLILCIILIGEKCHFYFWSYSSPLILHFMCYVFYPMIATAQFLDEDFYSLAWFECLEILWLVFHLIDLIFYFIFTYKHCLWVDMGIMIAAPEYLHSIFVWSPNYWFSDPAKRWISSN